MTRFPPLEPNKIYKIIAKTGNNVKNSVQANYSFIFEQDYLRMNMNENQCKDFTSSSKSKVFINSLFLQVCKFVSLEGVVKFISPKVLIPHLLDWLDLNSLQINDSRWQHS